MNELIKKRNRAESLFQNKCSQCGRTTLEIIVDGDRKNSLLFFRKKKGYFLKHGVPTITTGASEYRTLVDVLKFPEDYEYICYGCNKKHPIEQEFPPMEKSTRPWEKW